GLFGSLLLRRHCFFRKARSLRLFLLNRRQLLLALVLRIRRFSHGRRNFRGSSSDLSLLVLFRLRLGRLRLGRLLRLRLIGRLLSGGRCFFRAFRRWSRWCSRSRLLATLLVLLILPRFAGSRCGRGRGQWGCLLTCGGFRF